MQAAFLLAASTFYIWRQAQTAKTDPDKLDPELHHMLIGTSSSEDQQQSTGRLRTMGFADSDCARQEVAPHAATVSHGNPKKEKRWPQRDASITG